MKKLVLLIIFLFSFLFFLKQIIDLFFDMIKIVFKQDVSFKIFKKLAFISCLFLYGSIYSQDNQMLVEKNLNLAKSIADSGTYQIIIDNLKVDKPLLTDEFFFFVENSRKDDEDVFLSLGKNITLFIPSRNKIKSKSFKLLPAFLYK